MSKASPEAIAAALRLWRETDLSTSRIAKRVGLTKGTVIGLSRRPEWRPRPEPSGPTTLAERMDALHAGSGEILRAAERASMDAVGLEVKEI